MSKAEQDVQKLSRDFQKIQAELAATVEARQRLDYQQSETDLVLQEMKTLKAHNTVYKLIGPALIQQDQTEAKQTVEKRLDFIHKEIDRIEAQLKDIETRAEKKKAEIVKIQTEYQQAQASQAGGGGAGGKAIAA